MYQCNYSWYWDSDSDFLYFSEGYRKPFFPSETISNLRVELQDFYPTDDILPYSSSRIRKSFPVVEEEGKGSVVVLPRAKETVDVWEWQSVRNPKTRFLE